MGHMAPYIVNFEEEWQSTQETIAKLKRILEADTEEKIGCEEYILIYTKIYNMAVQFQNDYPAQIYNKYKETFYDYINSKVLPSLRELRDESLLKELVRRWEIHKVMVRWLSRFFYYLDKHFVRRRAIPTLKEAGLASFRDQAYQEFKSKAANVVIALINKERKGEKVERGLLKNVIKLYIQMKEDNGSECETMTSMDCYENDFEAAMLKDTAEYYSRKASDWLAQDTWPDYMLKAEDCLKKEKDRVAHYLHASTETKLLEEVQNQFLVALTPDLLEKKDSGCLEILRDNKVGDLSRMYRLFQKIPQGLESIAKIFKQHVTSEGMALMSQAEDAMSTNKAEKKTSAEPELALVRKVINLHDRYLGNVTGCFSNDSTFHKSRKEAFEFFLNKPVGGTQTSEILSSYCDDILKKGGVEKLSEEAIEETLDKVIHLLSYISDKDLFAEFCRKKLSRRLLFDRSASQEHEKFLVTKLKEQFGHQFTSKMEGMITDIALKDENQKKFQNFFNEIHTLGMDFNATVLTTGVWPTYKSRDLNLPPEMAKCIEVYKDFYKCAAKHRKLTWIYSLGTCNINGIFEQRTIELVVTTLQAAVLLLFNDADKLSYSDIKSQLNLEDDDVIRLLHSLSCAKYKILNKEPNTKSVSQNDSFEFNYKFTDKMRKIRIPLPPVDERKKVVESVEKDRRLNIDAAIVRIMKGRKVLGYQQLIAECVQQLSPMFKPDFREIKKRIEALIAQEYIERDPENPCTFKYVA